MFTAALLLAIRSRFVSLSLIFSTVLALAALCAAEFSGRQPATVALDVGLSVMRLVLPLMAVLLVQEVFSREFERRYYLSSLTYPCTRHGFFLARFIAVLSMLGGVLLTMALVLALVVWWVARDYQQATAVSLGWHYVIALFFVGVDLLVITALAALLAIFASSPSFVLIGTLGFMLVARSYASVIELLAHNSSLVGDAAGYQANLGLLGYLLPNLGALDVRAITLYGKLEFLPADWPWLMLSSLAYVVGLLALAIWVLHRKRFA